MSQHSSLVLDVHTHTHSASFIGMLVSQIMHWIRARSILKKGRPRREGGEEEWSRGWGLRLMLLLWLHLCLETQPLNIHFSIPLYSTYNAPGVNGRFHSSTNYLSYITMRSCIVSTRWCFFGHVEPAPNMECVTDRLRAALSLPIHTVVTTVSYKTAEWDCGRPASGHCLANQSPGQSSYTHACILIPGACMHVLLVYHSFRDVKSINKVCNGCRG